MRGQNDFSYNSVYRSFQEALGASCDLSSREKFFQNHPAHLFKPAAVLLLYFRNSKSSQIELLFTERAKELAHHAGQISFPGGACDPEEPSHQAALRELQEEVGISSNRVEIVGSLPGLRTVSYFEVTPWVALYREEPSQSLQESSNAQGSCIGNESVIRDPLFVRKDSSQAQWGLLDPKDLSISQKEVERCFGLPWDLFLRREGFSWETRQWQGRPYEIPSFTLQEEGATDERVRVWGATAEMIHQWVALHEWSRKNPLQLKRESS